jgi:hypothetical protein
MYTSSSKNDANRPFTDTAPSIAGAMSEQCCNLMHPLIPSPVDLQPQACCVCATHFMPSMYHTLSCSQCQTSLCASCVLLYTPETAFAMHLATCGLEPVLLERFAADRTCATTLFRDPYLATVYHEYQRFYNTDEYQRLLEERVLNLEHEALCLQKELQNTKDRLSGAKYELLAARRKRRTDVLV